MREYSGLGLRPARRYSHLFLVRERSQRALRAGYVMHCALYVLYSCTCTDLVYSHMCRRERLWTKPAQGSYPALADPPREPAHDARGRARCAKHGAQPCTVGTYAADRAGTAARTVSMAWVLILEARRTQCASLLISSATRLRACRSALIGFGALSEQAGCEHEPRRACSAAPPHTRTEHVATAWQR